MTSPSIKRPFDLHTNSDMSSGSNGIKRRCTMSVEDFLACNSSTGSNSSIFNNALRVTLPLDEHINSLIKNELHLPDDEEQKIIRDDAPVLSIRQTKKICETLIQQRELKLRDEFNKILASNMAQMYDDNHMTNQIKSFESRINPNHMMGPNNNGSMDVLTAAAYSMHRASNTPSIAHSIPSLNSFAASLSTNGDPHLGNLTREQILAINLHQAANAVALQNHHRNTSLPIIPNSMNLTNNNNVNNNNSITPSGPVLLVSNLDEQLATPEALFTLFGVFGDVMRVKILFNKKDNALIQMADANQAHVAQGYLDRQMIYGKSLRVTRSKHQLVQMPRDTNQTDAGLTKDFTNSPLHRFKIPGSRNYANIYPPSNTLHISNIPATIEEDVIKKAFFEACKFECSSFKFFPNNRKMALMAFESNEHATIALIKMHNHQLSEENNLRVSFSKSMIYN